MKKITIIISILLLTAAVSNAYMQNVTHGDLEQIFEILFSSDLDSAFGKTDKKTMYIIANEYFSEKYQIKHAKRTIKILSQKEFDRIQSQTKGLIGWVKITNIEYGKSELYQKENAVTVSYVSGWYGGDGGHGVEVFTKESGQWAPLGGFSMS